MTSNSMRKLRAEAAVQERIKKSTALAWHRKTCPFCSGGAIPVVLAERFAAVPDDEQGSPEDILRNLFKKGASHGGH